MRIGSDHHTAGEGVVFEHDLVNDTCAGLPKSDSVLIRNRGKEVEHLVRLVDRLLEVGGCTHARLNQVVAVHRRGNRHFFAARRHKLKQGHLGRRVLHRHAVWGKVDVRGSALEGLLCFALPKVSVQNFLREGQGAAQHAAGGLHFGFVTGVKRRNHIEVKYHN